MFTISCGSNIESGVGAVVEVVLNSKSWNAVVADNLVRSTRPAELSTSTIFCSKGRDADSTLYPAKSGAICLSKDKLSRGSLNARFVSAPSMKCAASRCESAEMTCVVLKLGFKGTCYPSVFEIARTPHSIIPI